MPKARKIPWTQRPESNEIPTNSRWDDVQKHSRYISNWDDNVVVINVAHKIAKIPEYKKYDLTEIIIPRINHVSIDGDFHYRMADFPHLLTCLKAALNATLFGRTSGVSTHIAYFIIHASRVFGWMFNRGQYALEQLSIKDTTELRDEFRLGGWSAILKFEESLSGVLRLAEENPRTAESLVGQGKDRCMTIRTSVLTLMIGMPLARNDVPRWFARKLHKIVNSPKPTRKRIAVSTIGKTAFARFMGDMNRFAEFPISLGGMAFTPYPNANKDANAAFVGIEGRTVNIPIDDAVKILAEALRWTRDYAPIILEVAAATRQCLENELERGTIGHRVVRAIVRTKYQEVTSRLGNRIAKFSSLELSQLNKCISTLQVACFCIIASNHGRRLNEVVGRGVPYGLYYGCISTISNVYEDVRIDIYVEKSFQEYVSFWCNSLVREAVQCLENIAQLFRPLNSSLKEYKTIRENARNDKLFLRRSFTKLGFSSSPEIFEFSAKCELFFELAQVDVAYMNERTHPFRRVFGLLFKYRYDRFRIAALGQHYGHEFSSVTEVYLTDAAGTSPTEGVQALFAEGYGRELSGFKKVMEEISTEYLTGILLRMLKGELIGGVFARMALKLMQRLSSSAKFTLKSDKEKAEQLGTQLTNRGYSTAENGSCQQRCRVKSCSFS